MTYYNGGSTGNGYASPGVSFGGAPRSSPSNEGKAAKKVLTAIQAMDFDVPHFAFMLAGQAGDAMDERIMEIVKNLIRVYASEYEAGKHTEHGRQAMKLADAMYKNKML